MQWSGVPTLARGPAAVRMPGRLTGESLNRLGKPTFRLGLQSQEQTQEQHIRLDEDQLTTDTTDWKTTEKTLAKDTAAFEDTTQDYLVCQTYFADFDVHTNKMSEELEALAKAKVVITEAQLTFHVASTMHAEKGEAEESEPPRTARSGDIVMVIDGER